MARLPELEIPAGILSKQPSTGGGTGNKAGEVEDLGKGPLEIRMEEATKEAKAVRDLNTSVVSFIHHKG